MLEVLFGSITMERVLIYIYARKEGYAREIARFFDADLTPVQNQLKKLENGSILVSKLVGRTRLYYLNPRYPFIKELNKLLEKAIGFLSEQDKEKLVIYRTRPRRSRKPI
jgi:predicted transcriptional regulator